MLGVVAHISYPPSPEYGIEQLKRSGTYRISLHPAGLRKIRKTLVTVLQKFV
jgi:hypothetical protein